MTIRILAWSILLALSMWLATAADRQPVPPYIPNGDDEHAGQPSWCQREHTKYEANCTECEQTCQGGQETEDAKCKTYCRKGSCQCHPPCST